jgi:hypothetical protein
MPSDASASAGGGCVHTAYTTFFSSFDDSLAAESPPPILHSAVRRLEDTAVGGWLATPA